jgi:hypothetical protein
MTTTHTTAENAKNLWCGEATLDAFGIEYRKNGRDMGYAHTTLALRNAGFTLTEEIAPWDAPVALGTFIETHREGDWVLFTNKHAMALRDNVLIDTEFGSLRRRIVHAYRVSK